MSDLNLAHILRLLKEGEEAGINISLVDDELRVHIAEEKEIDEQYLKQLRDNKSHIIEFFKSHGLKKEGIAEINSIPSYNRNIIARIPLSYGQERLWFIDRLEGSVHYHVPVVLKLKGEINRDALQYALQNIINRHEVLRTVVREEDGIAYQHILPPDNWQLLNINNPGDNQQATITHFLNQPFNLSVDHMLRAGLMSLTADNHILALTMHHIASDGWSDTVIVKELVEFYSAYTEGRTPSLSPLPIQYADYAIWQREYISGKVLAELQQYWEKKLSGLEPLNLSTDYARPAVQSTNGAVFDLVLDQGLTTAANRLSQQQGTTLFMVLLSVLKVLLYRYSGQEDICVGTPVAGRRRREIESLVGFFINTLAIRSSLDRDTTFAALLQQVRNTVLEGFDHQDLPFEKVVDAVVKERNNGIHPLFQVMFVFQNGKKTNSITLGDVSLIPERPEHHTSKFDLTFTIVEEKERLSLTVEYCTDLYQEDTIRRMATHYEQLLRSAVSKPEGKIDALPMLVPEEENLLLNVFSGNAAGYPKDKTIVDLFEAQVAQRPDAVAVVYEDQQLTYRQLNERANQIGHVLRSKGVREDTLVPVCINRSLEMITGMLGVLKAGAAYVPIDPLYPEDRIRYMLEDTKAAVVISNSNSSMVCKTVAGIETVIELDTDQELISAQPVHAVESVRSANHAAYVIYTSGSTGRPKGVVIEHVNVVRLFETDMPLYDFNENDVWSMFHSFCFDFSVWEMYGALFYGGRLVVVPREATQDTTLFAKLLLEQRVTVLNQTPSAFYVLQDYLTAHTDTVFVRYVIFGGEALNPARTKAWKGAYPACRLINMYGITETTVHVTYQELEAAHLDSSTSVIGKPIPTLYAYVLNSSRLLAPVGVPGELYIGGAGLAREYLNLPVLSAERFITNPFVAGERLYKTGDLARWLPDGTLEYLGRIDDQVKIRGFRIELGEIENVLQQSGLVSSSVVIAQTDVTGNKRLIGYVVPIGTFDKDAVQSWLKAHLPEYMVPAIWVPLEEIPLTSNGKVNKKALPNPDPGSMARAEFVAPRNESEVRLAAIWQELLGVERVGIHDNFFELGGDSIRVIRVVSKISQVFDKQVRVFDVYRANTIQDLAVLLDKQDVDSDHKTTLYKASVAALELLRDTLLPQLPDAGLIEDIYPMSDIERGMVYASMLNAGDALYHDQFVGRIPREFDAALLTKAFNLLTNRHSILRTAFRLDMDTQDMQVVYKSVDITVDYFDIPQEDQKDIKNIIQGYLEEERKKPFVFDKAPLWRVALFGLDTFNIMVFQFHHAILDGWSVASLNTELFQLCKRLLSEQEPVILSPLKSSYKDFILESMVSGNDNSSAAFWKQELDGYKRLDIFSKENGYYTFNRRYGNDFLLQLKEKTKQDNISLKALFLGAYLFSLNMLTYEEELTIGLVTNNRPVQEDGDKLLGCFLNTIPFRFETEKRVTTWKMYFENIEEKLIQLKEHDRLSLSEIAKVTKESAADKNPFFDAMFNFVNFHVYEALDKNILDGSAYETGVEAGTLDGYELTNTFLDCTISLTADVFSVSYTLRRALKSGKTPEELEAYFNSVLMHYLEHYNISVAESRILSVQEEAHLLQIAAGPSADYPQQETLVSLFAEQVLRTPDAVAVMYEEAAFTYRELDERSNQLGHYLRKLGVKADTLVPVCIDRSLDMMVALLGILKAGGAYVPVDPTYPAARISFTLKDTAAKILICSSALAPRMDGLADDVYMLTLDAHQDVITQEPVKALDIDIHPDNLAYVIYTSGSTGTPKGVMNAHRGIVNRLLWTQDYFGLDTSDVVLQKTTFCFDVSVWELFWPLITGARLVFAQPGGEKDGAYLSRTIERYGVTTIHFVPSMLQAFTENLTAGACAGLRRVLCSGEALQAGHIRSYRSKLKAPLYNLYGPTEAAIDVSCWHAADEIPVTELVPIGRPVANTRLYILDAAGNLAPAGVAGELHIGGVQVARGYLNREELTAQRFINSPFRTNERMYKTGDLARWLPDANIEYLGRIDEQVKIRGYRIELGEIENVLQQSGLVKQVVVLAKPDSTGNRQLVGYVVPEQTFSKEQVVQYLGKRLPEYMVPALWVVLETLPLTANGKADRKNLPDPELNIATTEYVAPRNETEQLLADIWQQLLGISLVGIYDNFFELGGHSLLGMRIVAALRQRKGIELSIKDLFSYPDIAGLAGFIRTDDSSTGLPAVTVAERPARIPLSYSQERLWFIDQLEGSLPYHIPAVLRLKGRLHRKALADALAAIVSRHEILRTVIRAEDGQPYQQVLEAGLWQLQIVTDYDNSLQEYIHSLIKAPFDLSADHMLRAHLIALNEDDYVLVVTQHHIASDAWSASIIVQELVALYSAYAEEHAPALPALPLQYADYAIWQRTYLSGVLDKKMEYWKDKLSGVSTLQLPVDYPRQLVQHSEGAEVTLSINTELTEELKRLSQQQGTTLFMTMLAAFKVLLYRYTHQTDVCVGTSTGARPYRELEGLIGFFVNTLALRSDLNDNPSFISLLQQVKTTTLGAYEHQEVPFEKIVEAVVKDRDASRSPLFQAMFVMQNTPDVPELHLDEVVLSGEPSGVESARFDITFFAEEKEGGLELSIVYRSQLFSEDRICRMAGHYEQLLQAVVRNPSQHIDHLPLLTTAEQYSLQILTGKQVPYAPDQTIVDMFAAVVARTPQATALVFEGKTLSYQELDQRSDRLAAYLHHHGVGANTLVPLFIERSADMVVGILGILKAGGAYVPVEQDYPQERISYILKDTAASVIVSSSTCRGLLPATTAQVIALDENLPVEAISSLPRPSAKQLLYVIYTSGSTGAPKGVMVTHRNLADYLAGLQAAVPITECQSFALLTGIATDLGNTVLYGSLAGGGELHLFSKAFINDSEKLHTYFESHRIDCIKVVPSYWKAVSAPDRLLLPEKLLIFGGEALETAVVDSIRATGNGRTIVNHYGPTETTIGKLLHVVNDHADYGTHIPIGTPFSNTRVYVLSPAMELCPAGIPGELYIGGDGVAAGYLHNETLTAQRFIDDPFQEGAKLYRTGDIVKYAPDGNILFIGRGDDQVKIRGYRVELGEIERTLNAYGTVEQGVVIVRGDAKTLVGYVTVTAAFDKEDLLSHLKTQLPDYMVPAQLVVMEQFPLLNNGKIDRRALPDPEAAGVATSTYAAPVTALETALAGIWSLLLEVPQVGLHDDFFALGGHSLLAIRLISAMRKQLSVEVTIADVFDYPTISQLAVQLDQRSGNVLMPAITRQERPRRIPLSYSQERLWFIDQLEGSIQYHIPSVLRLTGQLNREALAAALQELVNRHEVLRTVIAEEDGMAYQRILDANQWQLIITDDPKYGSPAALQDHIQSLITTPFDLSADHMLRAHLIVLGEEESVLVVVLHHIASDAWSTGIIVRELIMLYDVFTGVHSTAPAPLLLQYADYAIWQRAYLTGDLLGKKLEYWKNKLTGVGTLQLPVDYVRPATSQMRAAVSSFTLDASLSARIKTFSLERGITPFMTLLAVLKILLHRYSDQDDICVGTPVAGRMQEETEGLLGFFINTLALRSSLAGNPSFAGFLQQIKEMTLGAYEHQDVPFEKVVEAVVKERDTSRSPLFQVLFSLQNAPEVPALRLGEVTLTPEPGSLGAAQFDLIVSVEENKGQLNGSFVYSADLFHADTIDRMMAHFRALLEAAVTSPDKKIGSLNMLQPAETILLQKVFNDTMTVQPEGTMVALFAQQAAQTPPAAAVIFDTTTLTYKELDERSGQLARYLQGKGVKKGTLLPICVMPSVEMIVGILGIMKAGAAYVPIDPEFPPQRIQYILEDTGAGIVLSSSTCKQVLPALATGVILLDEDWQHISGYRAGNMAHNNAPSSSDLAYVIYTSGSTGKPKGVMISHGSLLNYLLNSKTRYINDDSNASGSYIHLTYTFDASLTAMFMPLIAGKKIVIGEKRAGEIFEDPQLWKHAPYDFIKLTPAHMPLLEVSMGNRPGVYLTNRLVLGGEALQWAHFRYLSEHAPDVEIINEYGPTEATVGCSTYRIYAKGDGEVHTKSISIGKPIDNVQLYITDRYNGRAPVGVAGEICIAGAGLAEGYLNRPELTAEKFVADPFSTVAGARMYRTGDLGRWLPDGNLEYLGRKDDQVKVRGYRIELGEIESILQSCALVDQCVVLAKADTADGHAPQSYSRLVAYILPHESFDREGILSWLEMHLPAYMVPAALVEIDQVPLTANGKVDKQALLLLDEGTVPVNAYTAPRNEQEQLLADIWKRLLELPQVGVYDNFFVLGGHSLLVVRLMSAIKKTMQVEIQIGEIFEHPTIAALAQLLEGRTTVSSSVALVSVERPSHIPLSYSQERLWFIDQLEGSTHYHIPAVLKLDGDLNVAGLAHALRTIVNRHEVLRTVIAQENNTAYQRILDKDQWNLEVINEPLYKTDDTALQQFITTLISTPFNLSSDHMLRAHLIVLGEQEYILAIVLHHIASDGWSTGIIVRELMELYSAYTYTREPQLPELAIQYADYAIWQRKYLSGAVLEKQLDYWKNKLTGVTALELPTDYTRPVLQSTRGNIFSFQVDGALSSGLRKLSLEQDTTLFMTLLAAFKVCLSRYSGQADICVGTPSAGRTREEAEGLIGFFINTLALRNHVDKTASFISFLKQVKENTVEAYAHQEIPFEKVVEAVVKERDISRTPLFQVMFELQNIPQTPRLKLGNVTLSEGPAEHTTSKFDLTFALRETPDGLEGHIEYCADLFAADTIDRMQTHFKRLLQAVVQNPGQRIDDLEMLDTIEKQLVLETFNATAYDYPKTQLITDLFEARVSQMPDAIALVLGDQQLTYRELDERSDQLAHYLQGQGLTAGNLVPLCTSRSFEMMIGMLGILKAGGAYVPVDPEYPAERIGLILRDCGEEGLVVTTGEHKHLIAGVNNNKQLICIDQLQEVLQHQPKTKVSSITSPEDLAYIIYTSGSTGKPKGVMVPHSAVVNMIHSRSRQFGITSDDKLLQFYNYCFDAAAEQIYLALASGATLVLIADEIRLDKQLFTQLLEQEGITHLDVTPGFLATLTPGKYGRLKRVVSGGEACSPQLAGSWATYIDFYNAYGPTETTVTATGYLFTRDYKLTDIVPIGKPLDNVKAYILDDSGHVLPVGVPGELYLGGVQVAKGYLNMPHLTAEKFVIDPFNDSPAKLYRTGDLCKWLPDGNIVYLGRKDEQVKVRGYRIELGEIESVLLETGLVKQGVVIADHQQGRADKRLIAYVVPEGIFDKEAIFAGLQSKLPDYMVPAVVVELASLPLTSNGKIDKKALPVIEADTLSEGYVAPRNEMEQMIADVWQEVLGIPRVGIHDNFFVLGGHSLLGMRVIAALGPEAGISVKSLFLHPTVAGLAAAARVVDSLPSVSAVAPEDRPVHIPLSYSQERLWFIDQLEGSVQYHIPAVLRLKGNLNRQALAYALQEIVNRHEVLRTFIRLEDGSPYQQIQEAGHWQLNEVAGEAYADVEVLHEYVRSLIETPFDMSADHMLRAHLVMLNEDEYVLVVILHHIASDAWSTGIIVRELVELYGAYIGSRAAALHPLSLQYADYSIWQRKHLSGAVLGKKLDYWKDKLTGVATLQLPADYVRPAIQSNKGANIRCQVDRVVADELKRLSQQQGTTLFMTMLAVFKVLLYRYSNQTDVCVGTSTAARPYRELEGLIGFFVNTLALRSDLSDNPSFISLLQQVKTTTVDAYAHQEVPLEKIVEAVVKDRDASRSPLFQVMFVMQNAPDVPELYLEDVVLSGEDFEHHTAKFDITFFIAEQEDGLELSIVYRSQLFSEDRIRRMAGHFEQLLQAVVRNPSQQIDHLTLLTAAEQQPLQILTGKKVPYATDQTIVDMFAAAVARTPQAAALVFEGRTLSYQELDERSDRLAAYLHHHGVGANTLVPLFIERGSDMVVGILGILKAGGAYVPIEQDYPQERISYILKDTAATIIVSSNACHGLLPATTAQVVILDEDLPVETIPSLPRPSAEQLLYVIYTSGSTGAPKGVMVTHRNLADYLAGLQAAVPIAGCQSFALLTGIATDLGNTVLYGSLAGGGKLHLFSKAFINDSEKLHAYFESHRIDCIKVVPSYWKAVSAPDRLLLPEKLLIFGGEALETAVVDSIRATGNGRTIVNHYGPTETTIGKLLHVVNDYAAYGTHIPIGTPFSNTRVYVLSPAMELCPAGVPGELYIGGDGVAAGYLHNETLTAQRFIDDPFQEGAKLYRTGDIVRYAPDGNILFIGRGDDQVKIRGYRVELGEIERTLNAYGTVEQGVVIVRGDAKTLVGYVTVTDTFDKEDLLSHLKTQLPDYMVPAQLVVMEQFPLLNNGKIDRRALPDPETAGVAASTYAAPVTALETALAGIWSLLLEVPQVGLHDDFFALGGHSLLAIRLISAMRKQLSVEVTIADVFDYPTISQLAVQLGQRSDSTVMPAVIPEKRPDHIPLSYSQERLWFIDQLEGTVPYHIPAVLNLKGHLNSDALEYALRTIVNRHEVLRTVIVQEEGVPFQEVKPLDQWKLVITDHSQHRDNTVALTAYIKTLTSAPFNLSTDHKLRAQLIVLGEEEHVLVVTLHHIASDGWSTGIIVRELMELYSAFTEARLAQLVELPVQYADYAIWQRKYLSGTVLDKKLDYWKRKLADTAILPLPYDRPRTATTTKRGASRSFFLGLDLQEQLKALSQQQGVTMYMTLLTALKVLLYRYTGEEDICIGSPTAGRTQQEIEGLIGFFINTLALRSELKDDLSFVTLLHQVKQTTLEAYAHQEVPFEKVVEAVVTTRDLTRHPLFQVMFVWQNTPDAPALRLGEVELSSMHLEHPVAQLDLTFSMRESEEGLYGNIEYFADLFSEDTIAQLISHYEALLRAVVRSAEERISTLRLLSKEEEHILLTTFNAHVDIYPEDKTINALFAEQAALYPGVPAVVAGGQTLTYNELEQRSNQLAHYLQHIGVTSETYVGICIERSVEMIVSILGILKAGAAYVPVDPDYPEERISYMLSDTGAKIVLSSRASKHAVENIAGIIILLDEGRIADFPVTAPVHTVPSTAAAYVIFTSGSTGKPKGVIARHRGVVNLIHCQSKAFHIMPEERVLMTSDYCFDASVEQLFFALLNGGTLVLPDKEILADMRLFEQFLDEQRISHLEASPGLISNITAGKYSALKRILSGGEACRSELAERWSNYVDFYNIYGPTEASISALIYQYTANRSYPTGALPIGKPLANVRVYILDNDGHPVPVGVKGELYIGGAGVTAGYLNNPELTAARFINDPFTNEPGAKMYRSGDTGKWLPDGNILYLGRVDEQVKVRGYRIELGEIERVLQRSNLVKQAVVILRTAAGGDKQLLGYVVPEGIFNREELLAYLRTLLPAYMIPLLIELESLPLTVNGKVDKKKLPAPTGAVLSQHSYTAPRNDTEQGLADIWSTLLDIERVGINDNFFELGGHSLKTMSAIAKINKHFQTTLSPADIFRYPVLKDLAAVLLTREQDDLLVSRHVALLNSSMEKGVMMFPPAYAQGIVYGGLARSVASHSMYSFGYIDDADRLKKYVDLITRLQKTGPYILMGYSIGGNLAFEVAKALTAAGYHVSALILIDSVRIIRKAEDEGISKEELEKIMTDVLTQQLSGVEEELKAGMVDEAYAYSQYHNRMVNDGIIDADIYLLKSGEKRADAVYRWDDATTGTLRIYEGLGKHEKMITEPENLELNAAIIKGILEQLSKC
ncbi:non-ribosomal peptide synthase/polyketide synthase [Chitinophaga flava]|uniref:Carrier domain-containing protein n=1 Tax=Chitinophaga flava TaxID=2259036 RepID=A0A365Y0J2_9BACT|nr:non-ribosomal peptide synthase/polyketide synthase [Chitinophaga flava]RBL91355.1 hypothetical protein DF182_01660 [Chitinophaga flava]